MNDTCKQIQGGISGRRCSVAINTAGQGHGFLRGSENCGIGVCVCVSVDVSVLVWAALINFHRLNGL